MCNCFACESSLPFFPFFLFAIPSGCMYFLFLCLYAFCILFYVVFSSCFLFPFIACAFLCMKYIYLVSKFGVMRGGRLTKKKKGMRKRRRNFDFFFLK